MINVEISYLLYFIFTCVSVLGTGLTSVLFFRRKREPKPYNIPKPKFLHILKIWILFYFIALSVEWMGHLIGLWTWQDPAYIFLHAGCWWATILTVSLFSLSSLKPLQRYIILLIWVLLFEYLQEAFIHWVTHFPLAGNPFLTITIVMSLTCTISFLALDTFIKLKLLKKNEII